MPNVTYPLDTSGVAASNFIQNELHTVAESQFRDYYFIVPNFAPFYVDNFKVLYNFSGNTRQLVENVDFSFAIPYVAGTRVTGKAMYGAITINNLNTFGVLSLSYQTVGGDQITDRLYVLSQLADMVYNPRTTIWDNLTNVPDYFPPTPHYQDYDQYYGQEELVNSLGQLTSAISNTSLDVANQINQLLIKIGLNGLSDFLKLTGGTLTGPLYLSNEPTTPNQAVTKSYVDSNFISNDYNTGVLSQYATKDLLNSSIQDVKTYVQQYTASYLASTSLQSDVDQLKTSVNNLNTLISTLAGNSYNAKADIAYVDQKFQQVLDLVTYLSQKIK